MSASPQPPATGSSAPHPSMLQFYRDKTIFLTGATGVLGELFVQKLLRCGAAQIFVLLRPKKQQAGLERLAKVYDTAIYDQLRAIDPAFMQRIRIVDGDMGAPGLGIAEADAALLARSCDIVIHAAANVRFDCPLEEILLCNVRGTRDILRLAERFERLLSFVYVSTAFVHAHALNERTEERFHAPPAEPDVLVRLAERVAAAGTAAEKAELLLLTEKVIYPWPNTYSFSKSLAEEVVRRWLAKLPIAVVRPSMVIATYKDPIPGYCTNYFGLNGAIAMQGSGVSRIGFGDLSYHATVVCADAVINGSLAVVWDRVVNKQLIEPPVYTMVGAKETLSYDGITDVLCHEYTLNPWYKAAWLPRPNYTLLRVVELYNILVYQLIPALAFDAFAWLTGRKQVMVPISRRLVAFLRVLRFFITRRFVFPTDNLAAVESRLSAADRELFPYESIDMSFFGYHYMNGLRTYMLKEPASTLPAAKKKYRIIVVAHVLILITYYLLMGAFWYKVADVVWQRSTAAE